MVTLTIDLATGNSTYAAHTNEYAARGLGNIGDTVMLIHVFQAFKWKYPLTRRTSTGTWKKPVRIHAVWDEALQVSYAGPGIARQAIPADVLFRSKQ